MWALRDQRHRLVVSEQFAINNYSTFMAFDCFWSTVDKSTIFILLFLYCNVLYVGEYFSSLIFLLLSRIMLLLNVCPSLFNQVKESEIHDLFWDFMVLFFKDIDFIWKTLQIPWIILICWNISYNHSWKQFLFLFFNLNINLLSHYKCLRHIKFLKKKKKPYWLQTFER